MPVIGVDASRAVSQAPTGTEGYSYHLIRALLTALPAGYRARLYFRTAPTSEAFPGAELRIIPFPRLWTHVRLAWEMARYAPDVLFVPAHVLPPVRPRRTLATIHDLGYLYYPEAHPPAQRLYLDWSTRWNARVATHILADSEATKAALAREYDVPAARVTVVYPGYDSDLRRVADVDMLAQARARYAIPGPYILYLGRIQPRKNLARLLEAFARILPRYPDLTLVLAGPAGWLAEPIRTRAQELGVAPRVRFPGYIAAEDKAALLSDARVFAFPSLYEGFGFPVLEAQACGTPVLASNTSSLPEAAGAGALLVDPLDVDAIAGGLATLLDDPARCRALAAAGAANLRRFSWSAAGQQVAAVLAEICPKTSFERK